MFSPTSASQFRHLPSASLGALSADFQSEFSGPQASRSLVRGGTAMFALLALVGDLGCTAGPTLAGMISSAAGDSLRPGVVAAVIFPVMFLFAAVFLDNRRKEK